MLHYKAFYPSYVSDVWSQNPCETEFYVSYFWSLVILMAYALPQCYPCLGHSSRQRR